MRGLVMALLVMAAPLRARAIVPPVEPVPLRVNAGVAFSVPGVARTIYANPTGGTYSPGAPDDSRANRSSLLGERVDLPPFPHGQRTWSFVMDCLRELFAAYDVCVTDVDPGDAPHVEIVVGAHPRDIGYPDEIGGLAPMRCGFAENSIVFAFAGLIGDDYRLICEAAAQEVGHVASLDHAMLCDDVMTFARGCGDKGFLDEEAECGEVEPRPCLCGGRPTQNSHRRLLDVYGPHPPNPPPTVVVTSPADGAVLRPGFEVEAEVTDDGIVDHASLFLDGVAETIDPVEPWSFVAPLDLAPGPLVVEVRAYDEYDGHGSDRVSVTVLEVDGGPVPDASGDAGVESRGGGCECSAAPSRTRPGAAPVLVLVLVLGARSARCVRR